MFYDKEIDILSDLGHLDDNGLWVDGIPEVVKTIRCDVQPYSNKLAHIDYAFDRDVKYRVFCGIEPLIELGTQINYKDNIYYIVEIKDWDDYLILLLDDKKVA